MIKRAGALSMSSLRPRYLEPLAPIVFPEEALVPESQLHLDLRTLLYHLLSDYLGPEATVGSDQFVYFDASDPKRVVAPDVFAQLEARGERIRSWKTWERGAPDVAVEIVSDSDGRESTWRDKLDAYRRLGVNELLRFDPDAAPSERLRIWDRVEGALVERAISGDSAPSSVLPIHWVMASAEGLALALRIADEHGVVVPTRVEARRAEAEARRAEAEARRAEAEARRAEAEARTAAEARLRELEAELARLRGRG